MSQTDRDIQEIEFSINDCKDQIKLGKRLKRLMENEDFKIIVNKGYIEEESTRLALALSDDEMRHEGSQTRLNKALFAIGAFNEYLLRIRTGANQAKEMLSEHEEGLAQIRADAQMDSHVGDEV